MPATILELHDAAGTLVLALDEAGQVVECQDGYSLANIVPDRIIDAAAGGMDPRKMPPELRVHFCGDVEIANYGESWAQRGPWVMLRVPHAPDFESLRGLDVTTLAGRLEQEQLTLRAVIFEGDFVHDEAEPAPADNDWHLPWLFWAHPKVEAVLGMDASPFRGRTEVEEALAETLGFDEWRHVPRDAVVLWAVDNGVAHALAETTTENIS